MKLYEVISLQDFCNSVKDKNLPIKVAYKITQLMLQVEKESQFYSTEMKKIIDQYAQKKDGELVYTDDMTSIKIKAGFEEECAQKILELREFEVDLSAHSFSLNEISFLEITPAQLTYMMPLIKN
jgi:hypothetical protein